MQEGENDHSTPNVTFALLYICRDLVQVNGHTKTIWILFSCLYKSPMVLCGVMVLDIPRFESEVEEVISFFFLHFPSLPFSPFSSLLFPPSPLSLFTSSPSTSRLHHPPSPSAAHLP